MLGSLCRYLRFMGYDTISANRFVPGNNREDTELLALARLENRTLLTRDRELAFRAGTAGFLILSEDVIDQVRQLAKIGLVDPVLRLTRCSLCNAMLRPATDREILAADYAPENRAGLEFFFCDHCLRLYWNGSHALKMKERMGKAADPVYDTR